MNRRSFLTSLFKGVVTAAVAPQVVTHGLRLRRTAGNLWVVNPDWTNAPYEVSFFFPERYWNGVIDHVVSKSPWPENMGQVTRSVVEPEPIRFTQINGILQRVNPTLNLHAPEQ